MRFANEISLIQSQNVTEMLNKPETNSYSINTSFIYFNSMNYAQMNIMDLSFSSSHANIIWSPSLKALK